MQFPTHVKWRSEKFGSVVFDTLSEKVYVTGETGKDILQALEDGLDIPSIVARLQDAYDGTEEQIRADVTQFVDGLRSDGLLASDT